MIKKNLFLLLSCILLTSCNLNNKGEWIISDVSRDTLLTAETRVTSPSTLILKVNGQTDDSIMVHSIVIPGGKIAEEYRVDCYYPKISVQFKAHKAHTGNIKIEYYLP